MKIYTYIKDTIKNKNIIYPGRGKFKLEFYSRTIKFELFFKCTFIYNNLNSILRQSIYKFVKLERSVCWLCTIQINISGFVLDFEIS